MSYGYGFVTRLRKIEISQYFYLRVECSVLYLCELFSDKVQVKVNLFLAES